MRRAFSLVEVTMAIGIVSFCLLALVGLLPVGLNAIKTSREEAAAANVLELVCGSIRKAEAVSTNGTSIKYRALGEFSSLQWETGKGDQTLSTPLSLAGTPLSNTDPEKRLAVYAKITPPTATAPGQGLVTVAWPGTAKWDNNAWSNAQGSVSTWMVFLPSGQ